VTKLIERLAEAQQQGWADWVRNEADERALVEG
jgi:hypothetical protein